MAKTSKNNIYYNDDENSIADVLSDMKELAESTDDAIENAKYDDKQIKQNISNIEKKNTEQGENITNNTKSIEELKTENEILKAENKLIKEQIPSATASGNLIHIEDSGTLDFDWKIRGGHAQTITAQPENYIDDREARGKTILEATSLYLPVVNLKAGKSYYFKLFDENNKIVQDSRYLAVEFYDVNKVKIQYQAFGFPSAFTEETAVKVKYAKIYYNGNDTDKVIGNTVIKKIGLKITSSVSADDIDMFVPDSPSLDYPSEIETVGSNVNDFDLISYYNTAPVVNATKQLLNNGIKLNFEARADAYIGTVLNEGETLNKNWRDGCVSVKPNTTYTIQINSAPKCYISYLDENYKAIKGFTQFFNNVTFTTDAHTHYFYFRFGYSNKTSDLTSYEFTNIKIEKGSIATPYSLYNQGSVEIDVINKNLYNGKNEIGGINNDGSLNNNADRWRAIDYINVENSTDISINIYNITTTGALGKYCLYDKNYNFLSSTQIININTVVNVSNVSYFRFWFLNDKVPTNTKIQVETGSTPTTYAQHQSQTAIMPIQQEMLTGDYISSVEHHEWGKLVLTGNENFAQAKNANKLNYFYLNYNLIKIKGKIISNMLKSVKSGEIWNKTSYDDVVQVSDNKQTINIMLSDTTITTLQQFKEKLKELYNAETPIIIYYELATPANLELTVEQKAIRDTKLYTYKNITNIDVSDKLASVEVEYKKDQDTINKNYENRLAALEAASIS